MKFLYKLYSNEFFGIGLFALITILAVSFLIVLFLGKKDQKERNEKENKLDNSNDINKIVNEELESVSLPAEDNINNMEYEDLNENLNISSNVVLNSELFSETTEDNDIENSNESDSNVEEIFNIPDFNRNDLPSFADEVNEGSTIEESEELDLFNSIKSEDEETKDENESFELSGPEIDMPKRVAMPRQFSSVYLSKDLEEDNENEEEHNEDEAVKDDGISPIPLKMGFDLPKPFEMPKLNNDTEKDSENIEPVIDEKKEETSNIFSEIE